MSKLKFIQLFESFDDQGNYGDDRQFPDRFGNYLIRGIKRMPEEFIDDPSTRKVSLGDNTGNKEVKDFFDLISRKRNSSLPNPNKSVHFVYSTDLEYCEKFLTHYGRLYRVIPEEGATFGYFNGKFISGKNYWRPELGNTYYDALEYEKYEGDLDEADPVGSYYIPKMWDLGNFGTVTYEELKHVVNGKKDPAELFHLDDASEFKSIALWTESPCKVQLLNK